MKYIVMLVLAGFSYAAKLPDEQNNIDVYQKCNPAVVNITTVTLQQDFFFDIVPQKGVGSGAVIRNDGYIVTNDHVIGDAQAVEVTFADKSRFEAKVVGKDPDSDIAVIKVDAKGKTLSALEYGAPEQTQVGQKVLAIGNPFGLGGSLTVGIVSSIGRDIRSPSGRIIKEVIQTDAAINPGNSGGPLLDSTGKLIGINAQIFSKSGGSEGIGFAIPTKIVKHVVDELIRFGQVNRPQLGLYGIGLGPPLLQALKVPTENGVMVTQIFRGMPASRAGLKAANRQAIFGFQRVPIGGDVIYQIDSTPVTQMRDILDYLSDKKVGDSIVLHYYRNGAKRTATVKLSASRGGEGI